MKNKNSFSEKQRAQIRHWKNKIKNVALYKKLEILDYATKEYTKAEISNIILFPI